MVKRISVAVLIAVLVFCGAGCGKSNSSALKDALSKPFVMTAAISLSGIEANILINKTAPGRYALRFLSPAALCGIEAKINGDDVVFSYDGMESTFVFDGLAGENIIKNIVRLDRVNLAPETLERHGEYDKLSFDEITVLAVNGIPKLIDFGRFKISVTSFEMSLEG